MMEIHKQSNTFFIKSLVGGAILSPRQYNQDINVRQVVFDLHRYTAILTNKGVG